VISLSLVLVVIGASDIACSGLAEGRPAPGRALGIVAGVSALAALAYLVLGHRPPTHSQPAAMSRECPGR